MSSTSLYPMASSFYSRHCIYLPYMLAWFLFSSLLSVYNKSVFGQHKGHFPAPLLMTSVHFAMQWGASYALSTLYPKKFGGDVVKQMSWR